MATYRDIINNCRQALADPNDGVNTLRWQDDELLRHLNRALRQIAKDADLYRRTESVGYYSSRGVFLLPPGVLNVLDVFWKGRPLNYTDRLALRERDPDYMTQTGTPTDWWRGITNPNEVRLYPIPPDDGTFETEIVEWDASQEYGVIAWIDVDGAAVTLDQDEGLLVSLTLDDGSVAVLATSQEEDAGVLANLQVNGLIECTVSYLPDWVGVGDLDTVIPDREDIEQTLENGVLMHALRKSGREEDLRRSREERALFLERIERHSADRNSDFADQAVYSEGSYI